MIVQYTKPNLHTFLVRRGDNASGNPNIESLCLVPGVNEVDDELWAEAKKTKAAQRMLDEGLIKEVAPLFTALKDKEAEKVIGETLDPRLLNKFEDRSVAPSVKAAIRKQRENIEKHTALPKDLE